MVDEADEAERQKLNPIMRFLTGDSAISVIAGWVVFLVGIGWVLMGEGKFISDGCDQNEL